MFTKITNCLNEYLEKFELNAELGLDFSYSFLTDTVTYSVLMVEKGAKELEEVAHSVNADLVVDPFLLALFHEIGHAETFDDLEEEDWETYKTVNDTDYYWHNVEYFATEWAVNYLVNNYDEVAELWAELQPLILEIVENIED